MRKLIQASLLALALTAPIYAGDIGQPVTSSSDTVTAQGYMPNGIAETALTLLGAVLSLI
jgi:hypothetical protein